MTASEFKMWFAGFIENLEGRPTQHQWERIKERVAEIDNTPGLKYRESWPGAQYNNSSAVPLPGGFIGTPNIADATTYSRAASKPR